MLQCFSEIFCTASCMVSGVWDQGSMAKPTDNNSRPCCLPSPLALPVPLTMVSPEVFPCFGIPGLCWSLCWATGTLWHLLLCFSVTALGEEVTLLLQHPPVQIHPLRDTPGFHLSAARLGTLVNLEHGGVTLCFLTPQDLTSPAVHPPSVQPPPLCSFCTSSPLESSSFVLLDVHHSLPDGR